MDYYIERDTQGKIIAVYASEQFPNQEILSDNSTEINEFLNPTLTIKQIKKTKEAEIKAERDRRAQSGGYKVGDKWYHSDTFSRTQQMGLIMMGANVPPGTQWKTMDGSFVIMTQTLAAQIFAAAAASDIAVYTVAENHLVAMRASADPAKYDYSTGWPEVFTA